MSPPSSRTPFDIRWADLSDMEALHPLFRALYKHDVPEAPDPSDEIVSRHLTRLLNETAPHKLAVAWAQAGDAIGLAAVGTFQSISDPRPENWIQQELKELFVLSEWRSAGIGAQLISWIEAEARKQGVYRVDWHVKSSNSRGISFYEQLGATIIETRLSMRKYLKSSSK